MSTALGKRKGREDGADDSAESTHSSTLFVSNLPFAATSVDLQTLFSDLAPVRSAFVVTEQGTGVSKGVGYVSFAVREDAQAAYHTIGTDGMVLLGRKLRVQWADAKKHKDKSSGEPDVDVDTPAEPKKKKSTAPARVATHTPFAPRDPLAIRTIVISGLPSGIDSKVLWKKLRKYPGAESIEWPVKGADDAEDSSSARALFATPAAAQEAVTKLHAHVFKGALLSVTLKKRMDTLAKPSAPSNSTAPEATHTKPSPAPTAPNRASRLIVRNLPWGTTDADLRALFLPYGPLHAVHIPPAPAKGFAFVWFLSRTDAERALAGANGKTISAGLAERLMGAKQMKKKDARAAARAGKGTTGKDEQEQTEDGGDREEGGKAMDANKRVIAVDWALSKGRWEEEKRKLEEEEGAEDAEMGSAEEGSDASPSDGEGSSASEDGEGELGVHGDDSEGGSDDEYSGADDGIDEMPVKPHLPATDVGTTLFVRNVPYEATEDELRTLFRAFGPLRYARITIDHATGRGRGTGFACFWNKEDADKALAQSDVLKAETMGAPSSASAAKKKNPFKLPSLLTPDPSSSMARTLVLHGRTLDLSRAVTRDEAGKLREAGERAREKADKRNLYLLREGLIMPNTPAAESLTSADVEKRTTAFNARRALLRTNPALYVSRTRLSVRQLPTFASERALKRLALHAVRAFEDEARSGARKPLTADELVADAAPADADADEGVADDGDEDKEKAKKKKGKWTKKGRPTAVKQSKVVHQADRIDAVTGRPRSKGYGFVEMHAHADALRVLRWANNNAAVGPLLEEWWLEEVKGLIEAEEKKAKGSKKGEKEEGERDEARLKRMKEELERGGRKVKGTLIVEFSIENVQVVQRRAAKQKESREAPAAPKEPLPKLSASKPQPVEEDHPKKKVRRSKEDAAKPEEGDEAKKGSNLGSLIGRKRKKRKMGQ